MTEQLSTNYEKLFISLTEEEQEACFSLGGSTWDESHDISFFKSMGVSPDTIHQLLEKKIFVAVASNEAAQRYVAEHQHRYDAIMQRRANDVIPLPFENEEERLFVNEYQRNLDLLNSVEKYLKTTYRLFSESFYAFVDKKLDE